MMRQFTRGILTDDACVAIVHRPDFREDSDWAAAESSQHETP